MLTPQEIIDGLDGIPYRKLTVGETVPLLQLRLSALEARREELISERDALDQRISDLDEQHQSALAHLQELGVGP